MAIFIVSIVGYAVMCVVQTNQCQMMPVADLSRLVIAGTVEVIFEIAGMIKIYANKNKDNDGEE